MSLYSGYNANFDYGNGYSAAQNQAFNNTMNNAAQNTANVIAQYNAYEANRQAQIRANNDAIINAPLPYLNMGQAQEPGYYTAANDRSSFSGSSLGGGGGGSVFDTGTSGVNTYGQPGVGAYDDPITWRGLDNQQQNYIQQHLSAYGYTPEAGFFDPGGGWDQNYGPGGALSNNVGITETVTGGDGFTGIDYGAPLTPQDQINNRSGGFASPTGGGEDLQSGLDTYTQPKVDWDKYFNDVITPSGVSGQSNVQGYNQPLTDEQVSYMKQHIDRYGYGPTADFFDPGGGWDKNYGTGSRNSIAGAIMAQGEDPVLAKGDRLPLFDDTLPKGDRLPLYGSGGDYALTPAQQRYDQQHVDRYGYGQSNSFYAPGGGWDKTYGDLAGSQPAGTGGYAGAMGGTDLYSLTPQQQSYVQQHIDRYGYAPEQGFFNPGGGWDRNYGEGAPQSPQTTSGTDLRYSDAGYNPPSFASTYGPYVNNSGQPGVLDPMGNIITAPGSIQGTGGPSVADLPPGNPDYQGAPDSPFINRFGAGGYVLPNSPSQYTTQPYTSAQGTTYQPQIPPGFQTLFGPDNPNGALPYQGPTF